ncbi:MAG: hypothetical protein KJZ86_21950 [Caldilineaceae bacterium]|nr:hypothetical protein [Caldilineaceae bacterium]
MDTQRLPDGQIHDAPDSSESELVGGPIQENREKTANLIVLVWLLATATRRINTKFLLASLISVAAYLLLICVLLFRQLCAFQPACRLRRWGQSRHQPALSQPTFQPLLSWAYPFGA